MPISLDSTHEFLGWPTPQEITHPQGAGAGVCASLVRDKIGRALTRFSDAQNVLLGILVPDSHSVSTQTPIAVVANFDRLVSERTLRELQRLCWNFSHTPTLITFEPGLLRVWTCCESPDPNRRLDDFVVHRVSSGELDSRHSLSLENLGIRALHWVNLVSGEFFKRSAGRFSRDGRADQMLLGNLRYIRARLREAGLKDDDICHDLLARIIFVQFLFDRKDSDGIAALNPNRLTRLHNDRVLARRHTSFDSILSNYADTYRLFDWLNTKFNGDLFPGKGDTAADRARGWAAEKRVVTKQHLSLLADFVRGDVNMPSSQLRLWPQYSFDVIPLEFISSIYETFVTERAARNGIFYTPPHLVDFILDRVLPWTGSDWDLKVLDPACGSGIFLVKAFQRLVHRWKQANPDQPIRSEVLRRILERNIFGVDKDTHAVRVACFSLYLAMCDEIEPRHYWTQVVFPPMRDRRLICSDFFAEDKVGFNTDSDSASYDLVIGNAPWGDGLVTDLARTWAKNEKHCWAIANKDIGGLFLSKAACLVRPTGRVAMIQSANSMLFNGSKPALAFRQQLFTRVRVEEIFNLSTLRFKVFTKKSNTTKTSIAPACVIVLRPGKPQYEDRISYVSPKQLKPLVDEFTIVIEPHDRKSLTVREAAEDPLIWSVLLWGSPRDRALIRRLQTYPSLSRPGQGFKVLSRQGVIFGDRKKPAPLLRGRLMFDRKSFPSDSLLYLDAKSLPIAGEILTDSAASTDFQAFAWPQLILKQGWQKESCRFQARIVRSAKREGILCNKSYVTVHAPKRLLEAAWLTFNSRLAVYFLQLTSGRIAAYRPEALVHDLLDLPLPLPRNGLTKGADSYVAIDARAYKAFDLKDSEIVLIEDMLAYTLAEFRGTEEPIGTDLFGPTNHGGQCSDLTGYCEYVIRVLKAGFGQDKAVTATIFQQSDGPQLPLRLVAFELVGHSPSPVTVSKIQTVALLKELERLAGSDRNGFYSTRLVRIYDGSTGTPTIFVIKPAAIKYWTRSAGLNDGDEISLDLFRWQQQADLERQTQR
jgi:hypothetical protein